MINPKIFKAVLMAATKEGKDAVLKELVYHIGNNYDYNDNKVGHIVDMLLDAKACVTPDKVNLKWIEDNLEQLMYKHNEYNIRNIHVGYIDNIDCTIRINFECLAKINEDREDVGYADNYAFISFIDHPEILK